MTAPESITFCECFVRDGIQSLPRVIPTDEKLAMIKAIQDAGYKKMEVTSFSPPKLVPQFFDAMEVMKRFDRRPGVSYVVLIPNAKGYERFEQCVKEGYGAHEMILMISASSDHNIANFDITSEEAKKIHADLMTRAHEVGVKIIGCCGTVYGCAIMGDVPLTDVFDIVKFYIDHGASTIMLGDTTGEGNPVSVRERIGELQARWPDMEFIAHFHDTRGTGLVNSVAAIEMGVRYVDTSLGAVGGQPATKKKKYHLGHTGNTCSEDLIALVDEMGIKTGVDIDKLIALGKKAEEVAGQRMRSNVILCGRTNHKKWEYHPFD